MLDTCNMKKSRDSAVSAVIGVMLMLSVVVILAVVVSMYAGNLAVLGDRTPQATMDCSITLGKTNADGVFEILVSSVSVPVRSSDLEIVTSWSAQDTTDITRTIYGGNTTTGKRDASVNNTGSINMPYGIGPSISGTVETDVARMGAAQSFGVYALGPDMILRATTEEGMQALLGENWRHLVPGDTVRVKVVYVPTSGMLFDSTVVVSR